MSDRDKPHIIACIPAFNEERTIAGIIIKAQKYVDKVLVCDDGSQDLTGEIAARLGAEVIRHERNMGKGAAIKSLFKRSIELNPDIVVFLDADGQHDPDEIPRLVEPIERGEADVVIGSRYVKGARTDAPLYRKIGLLIIKLLSNKILGTKIADTQSGFRAFSPRALRELTEIESEGFGVESEQVVLAEKRGLKLVEIPITVRYGKLQRTSKRNPLLHGGEIIATILRLIVEERPLLCLGLPGSVFLLMGIALGTYLLLLFNSTRYFSIPIALITLGLSLLGIILIITALVLYSLNRLVIKIKEFSKHKNNHVSQV